MTGERFTNGPGWTVGFGDRKIQLSAMSVGLKAGSILTARAYTGPFLVLF